MGQTFDDFAVQPWPRLTRDLAKQGLLAVVPAWIVSRLIGLAALEASWRSYYPPALNGGPHTYRVADVGWFLHIATRGYAVTGPADVGSAAFMPLMPAVMRWGGDLLGGHDLVAGAIAANLGAFIAAGSLYVLVRMGLRQGRPNGHTAAVLAVWFFLVSPLALPLFIAYTEPILLALALPAWIAARYEKWALAGALSSVAVLARVSGISFAFGIGVMFLLAATSGTRALAPRARVKAIMGAILRPSLLWVSAPLAVYLGWNFHLYQVTGRWNATAYAQQTVWHRSVVAPWTGFLTTFKDLFLYRDPQLKMEFAATLVIVALAALLLFLKLWPEAALVSSAALVLACSSVWGSSLRGLEVMFPFWVFVGIGAARALRRTWSSPWVYSAMSLTGLGLFWWESLVVDGKFIP